MLRLFYRGSNICYHGDEIQLAEQYAQMQKCVEDIPTVDKALCGTADQGLVSQLFIMIPFCVQRKLRRYWKSRKMQHIIKNWQEK